MCVIITDKDLGCIYLKSQALFESPQGKGRSISEKYMNHKRILQFYILEYNLIACLRLMRTQSFYQSRRLTEVWRVICFATVWKYKCLRLISGCWWVCTEGNRFALWHSASRWSLVRSRNLWALLVFNHFWADERCLEIKYNSFLPQCIMGK